MHEDRSPCRSFADSQVAAAIASLPHRCDRPSRVHVFERDDVEFAVDDASYVDPTIYVISSTLIAFNVEPGSAITLFDMFGTMPRQSR